MKGLAMAKNKSDNPDKNKVDLEKLIEDEQARNEIARGKFNFDPNQILFAAKYFSNEMGEYRKKVEFLLSFLYFKLNKDDYSHSDLSIFIFEMDKFRNKIYHSVSDRIKSFLDELYKYMIFYRNVKFGVGNFRPIEIPKPINHNSDKTNRGKLTPQVEFHLYRSIRIEDTIYRGLTYYQYHIIKVLSEEPIGLKQDRVIKRALKKIKNIHPNKEVKKKDAILNYFNGSKREIYDKYIDHQKWPDNKTVRYFLRKKSK